MELIKAGRNPKELADEFACHVTTLHDWMKQNSVIQGGSANAFKAGGSSMIYPLIKANQAEFRALGQGHFRLRDW